MVANILSASWPRVLCIGRQRHHITNHGHCRGQVFLSIEDMLSFLHLFTIVPVIVTATLWRHYIDICTSTSWPLYTFIAFEEITAGLCFVFDEFLKLLFVLIDELFRQRAIDEEILHITLCEFYFSGHFTVRVFNVYFSTNYWQNLYWVVITEDATWLDLLCFVLDCLVIC